MSAASSHLLIGTCEKTMPLDEQAIGRGCAAKITQAHQLCGLDLERYKQALADGGAITVACTQQAPLFREIAENSPQAQLTFVNIRETAGWSNDAAAAGPKSAALIAAAGEDMPPISVVTLESQGVVLIYGCDEVAIEAGQRLADRLDITVLLTKPRHVTPRRINEFPVLKGTIRNARGHLGRFELAIDDYALPLPSSRAKLVFGPSRDGATSTCDLILDVSGGAPMFPAHELRPGYLRADPRDRAAVERAIAKAGGSNATVLFQDGEHGEAIIDVLARFGSGLPANVLPLRVNEVTQLGPEIIAAVFAYGGSGVAIVTRARPRHDILGLRQAVEMTGSIISALGFGADVVRILETDDTDQLRAMLDAAPAGVTTQKPAGFIPRGSKRSMLETTFRELHLAAPVPVDLVPLAEGAPFGGVNLNVEGCTLCHACVTACPTGALSDNPERAMLRFTESLCVQCGLCESTCPEKVITLEPRLDFKAWNALPRVLKEEEPFNCIACGKPFGP